MCARYLTPSQSAVEQYWQTVTPWWQFTESWRVLPTQQIPIVLSIEGKTTGRMMRWGLIPYTSTSKYPLINCTVEKLSSWYAWRHPWEHGQRCIFPMNGFYEPHLFNDGRKEPFVVKLQDRPVFGVAGIWERRQGEGGIEELSCALITTPANELLAEVHNEKLRMPAVLLEENHAAWLHGSAEEALQALSPYPAERMTAWQVSRRLYANKTPNDASLLDRVGTST